MKNFLILILFSFCFCAGAQTNRTATTSATGTFGGEISLPVIVTTKFAGEYPNIAPTWSIDEDHYAAQYRDEKTNLSHIVVYDRFGNVIRKENELDVSAHPKAVCSYYSKHYPDEKYVVWKSEDAKGKISYYSKREDVIVCFDKNGKFISTKPNKGKAPEKATQMTEKSK